MQHSTSSKCWTAAAGLLAALLWLVQLAGAWEPPYQMGEFSQRQAAHLTQVIEREQQGHGRSWSPERTSDLPVLPGVEAPAIPDGPKGMVIAAAGASKLHKRIQTLPAIRAPPHPAFSI